MVRKYVVQYYYWEIIELFTKILLTSVLMFVKPGTATQARGSRCIASPPLPPHLPANRTVPFVRVRCSIPHLLVVPTTTRYALNRAPSCAVVDRRRRQCPQS